MEFFTIEERIARTLYVIHQENQQIMSMVLAHSCKPKEYEATKEKIFKDWDRAFEEAMRVDE